MTQAHIPPGQQQHQSLLRFHLGRQEHPLYAQGFKDMAAKYFGGAADTGESLFHYRDGRPIDDCAPDIRFVGGKSWVGVLSVSGNTALLASHIAAFSKMLGDHAGRPVSMTLEEPQFGAEVTAFPVRYFFRDVAVRNAKDWPGSMGDLIINRLTRTLRDKRDTLGLDLPGSGDSVKADAQALIDRLQIRVHDTRGLGMRLVVADGPTKQYVQLLSGSLSMYCRLSGMWQIGNLQSRGHGRLIEQEWAR